jgi:formiminotetrahydrofolate cyclodeaminase
MERDPPAGSAGERPQPDLGAESLAGFLTTLASAAPAPGGGCAAAVGAALAAALVSMVCRVTAARGGDPGLAEAAAAADGARSRLLGLAADDAAAYRAVIAARRASPEARAAALERATEVPLEIAASAHEVLALAARVVRGARASTMGDLWVAAALAHGALDGAAITARLNLRDMADPEFRRAAEQALAERVTGGDALHRATREAVAERVGGGASAAS